MAFLLIVVMTYGLRFVRANPEAGTAMSAIAALREEVRLRLQTDLRSLRLLWVWRGSPTMDGSWSGPDSRMLGMGESP